MPDFNPADYPHKCYCGSPAYEGRTDLNSNPFQCTNSKCKYFDKKNLSPTEAEKTEVVDPNVKRGVHVDKAKGPDKAGFTDGFFKSVGGLSQEDNAAILKHYERFSARWRIAVQGAPLYPHPGQTWFNQHEGQLYRWEPQPLMPSGGWVKVDNVSVDGDEKCLTVTFKCNAKGLQKALEEVERKCHKLCQKSDLDRFTPVAVNLAEAEKYAGTVKAAYNYFTESMKVPPGFLTERENREALNKPVPFVRDKGKAMKLEDILTAQPMDITVGLRFYYDLIYGDGESPNKNGDVFPEPEMLKPKSGEWKPTIQGYQHYGTETGRFTRKPGPEDEFRMYPTDAKPGVYIDGKMVAGEKQTKNRPYDGAEQDSTGR